jgi:ABC-type Fe3+-hydroxamate transport system substrate-binding protein
MANPPVRRRRALARAYHALPPAIAAICVTMCGAGPGGAEGARRVVSLSPVATQILLGIDHGERLVAVDAVSARLAGVRDYPVTERAKLGVHAPDLVLVSAADAPAARRAAPAAALIEVAPHDFDDGWALCLAIGAALDRAAEARRFVRETSRPLAVLGAEAFGKRRPRVAAVLALEPLEVAGGHSFATDLIELAGGESVGHGTEQPRLAWSAAELARAAPELIVVVTPKPASPVERALASQLAAPSRAVELLVLDAERDWLAGALPAARQLRAWIAERAARPSAPPQAD